MNQPQVPTVPASPARVPRDCRVGGELHVGHGDTGQVQQALEYRGDTHAFRPSRLGSGSSTEPNGHRVRVTRALPAARRPCNPAEPVLGTREPWELVVDSSVITGASAARPRGQAPWPAPAVGLSGAAEAPGSRG